MGDFKIKSFLCSRDFVLALLLAANGFIFIGTLQNLGLFFKTWKTEFQGSSSSISLISSIGNSIGPACAAFLAFAYNAGLQPWKATVAAGLIFGTSLAAGSEVTSLEGLIILGGILPFIVAPFIMLAGFVTIGRQVKEENRHICNSIFTLGTFVGKIALSFLVVFLMEEMSWRGAFLILGAIGFHISIFGALSKFTKTNEKKQPSSLRTSPQLPSSVSTSISTISSDISVEKDGFLQVQKTVFVIDDGHLNKSANTNPSSAVTAEPRNAAITDSFNSDRVDPHNANDTHNTDNNSGNRKGCIDMNVFQLSIFKVPAFLLYIASHLTLWSGYFGMYVYLVPFMETDLKASKWEAAQIQSLMTIFEIAGCVLTAFLGTHKKLANGRPIMCLVNVLCMGLLTVALSFVFTIWQLITVTVLIGISSGCERTLRTSIIGDLFGAKRYQVPHGFSQCIAGPIAIAVPPLIGIYLDFQQAMTGVVSYRASFYFLAALEITSSLIMIGVVRLWQKDKAACQSW